VVSGDRVVSSSSAHLEIIAPPPHLLPPARKICLNDNSLRADADRAKLNCGCASSWGCCRACVERSVIRNGDPCHYCSRQPTEVFRLATIHPGGVQHKAWVVAMRLVGAAWVAVS
jgi:hypothetical protein